jgi:glyoxylase-like metal-dependent hydrolase (beta-lactamase superfamily II)
MSTRLILCIAALGAAACADPASAPAQAPAYPAEAYEIDNVDNPRALFATGEKLDQALAVNEAIFAAIGFGNTFMVTTSDGNVIIDTSRSAHAARHKVLLKAKSTAPIRFIVLTHGHGDHTGGVALWREHGTEIVAQRRFNEFLDYQERLRGLRSPISNATERRHFFEEDFMGSSIAEARAGAMVE